MKFGWTQIRAGLIGSLIGALFTYIVVAVLEWPVLPVSIVLAILLVLSVAWQYWKVKQAMVEQESRGDRNN